MLHLEIALDFLEARAVCYETWESQPECLHVYISIIVQVKVDNEIRRAHSERFESSL